MICLAIGSLGVGAVDISYKQIVTWLLDALFGRTPNSDDLISRGVFFQIRLPRTILCMLVGMTLSVSGSVMQSVFRNPIVEPGLVGTSSGAAFGAALVFVFGNISFLNRFGVAGNICLPLFAFIGAWIATLIVYKISSGAGKVSVGTMLLSGMAINSLATAGTGFLSYIARDPQARSITFWNLGTFTGADWKAVIIVTAVCIPTFFAIMRHARYLNLLQLGDIEAQYLGVDSKRVKRRLIFLNTLMVAAATSMVGVIAFIGLLVPHLIRLIKGSDHRYLIPSTALMGAIVMLFTDMVSRTIIAPAEMPIGIIAAFVGAPLFLWLLLKNRINQNKNGIYD
jgi:iron complex transport system permease protein